MSEFTGLMNIINEGHTPKTHIASTSSGNDSDQNPETEAIEVKDERGKLFDIKEFSREVDHNAEVKNRAYAEYASNINAYDIAHNCIRQIVYKLLKTPVASYKDKWLPLSFRSTLGTACHDYIQGTSEQFTEGEVSVKVPSIKFSGRLDNMSGNNILQEIKSCTYSDYKKILSTKKPRKPDFYQTMTYKYVLENYLEEIKDPNIKTRTPKPALDKYNIDTIQFIYIAHDITASDIESLNESIEVMKNVKKMLNSKRNPFFFITTVVIDLNSFDNTPFIDFIKNKIAAVNWYLEQNKLPPAEDNFIKKSCFFCPYTKICDIA